MNLEPVLTGTFGVPTLKQEQFYEAATRYTGYGGAKGGGKSHAIRAKSTTLAYQYPGIQMLIIRRTLQELRENHTNRLLAAYQSFPVEARPKYNADEKAFLFPNSSRLKLGYCDNEQDVLQYQGQEYDVVFIDEATQLTEYQFGWVDACIRGTKKYPKRMYLTFNPGGVGHGWVKRLFVDRKYHRSEREKDYTFIQAKVWDNQPLFDADLGYLSAVERLKKENKVKTLNQKLEMEAKWEADYVRNLNNRTEQLRRAWLDGDWDVFEGQYFTEWDEAVHVIKPFALPSYWRKSISIDYGLDMLAVVWVAIDEHGRSYVYRNVEESNLPVEHAIAKIRRLTTEHTEATYAPPDLWNRHSDTGRSTADMFAENGMPLIRSSNSREAGWLNVKEYIRTADGEGKTEGYPRMLFFDTCTPLLTNIPLLQYDPKKTSDVCTEPHIYTHSPDALRGWCSMRQLGTREPEEVKPDPFNLNRKPRRVVNDYLMKGYN